MALKINPKHLFVGLGVLGFLGLFFLGGTLAFAVLSDRQVATYPGSMQITNQDVFNWTLDNDNNPGGYRATERTLKIEILG